MATVRERLAKKIVEHFAKDGITVLCDPKDLWPAQGYWRQVEQDVYSWEGYLTQILSNGSPLKFSLGSWDRMTTCLKGFVVIRDGCGYEIQATHELDISKRFKVTNK